MSPHQRIMRAAKAGRGIRLTAAEVQELAARLTPLGRARAAADEAVQQARRAHDGFRSGCHLSAHVSALHASSSFSAHVAMAPSRAIWAAVRRVAEDGTDHTVQVTLTATVYTEGEEEPTETTVTLPLGEVTLINGESWGAPDNWVDGRLLKHLSRLSDVNRREAYTCILSACAEPGEQVTVQV